MGKESGVAGRRERVGNGNDNEAAGREKIRTKTVSDTKGIPSRVCDARRACMHLLVSGALVLVSPWLSVVVYSGTERARTPTQPRERTMRALRHP